MNYRIVFKDAKGRTRRTAYSKSMIGALSILTTNRCADWRGKIERI